MFPPGRHLSPTGEWNSEWMYENGISGICRPCGEQHNRPHGKQINRMDREIS